MLDKILRIPLGGQKQTVHILTEDVRNPLLLFLHGGPGVPDRGGVLSAKRDWASTFTLVTWDQRGCGGSYWGTDFKTLTPEQLVEDAAELVAWLCAKFAQEKLFLLCGSWGTTLGTWLCARHPENIAAYVGQGQTVNGIRNEELSYGFALREALQAGDLKDLKKLAWVGAPVRGQYRGGLAGLLTQRNVMKKYGGFSDKQREGFIQMFAKSMAKSGEFTWTDMVGNALGSMRSLERLWPLLVDYDFPTQCHTFAMPYYIFAGRHDNNTPADLVQAYYDVINAPDKDLVWFENSAHGPSSDEPERFWAELTGHLLPLNQK
ncbi:MAG: alpha/beta hydrolase [Oscillospiraceae bacterium]|jgi:pimeloyl-ACP methyl ester carboxylesterase|nr:alpha/beta hydrolase [Oscillospiraceae bacterium]